LHYIGLALECYIVTYIATIAAIARAIPIPNTT
jgi:hypothetical protein